MKNSSISQRKKFREEDNEKRERLRFLKKEIGMPFDEPVQFEATDLANNTNEFEKYFKRHSEEYCALRLIPKHPDLPKLRMRGLIIRKAYDWFKEQDIDPTKYRADFIPHSERPLWSTIFVVNKNGIFGEIIRGMHNQLTQGFFDVNRPILFSHDFKKLTLSDDNEKAEKEVRKIIDYLYVKDSKKRKLIEKEFGIRFFNNYLEGYFETITVEEFGLWFIDFNRILGKIYEDFEIDIKRVSKKASGSSKITKGRVASAGIAKGAVRIIDNNNVFKKTLNKGDILVCEMTTPDYIVHIKNAAAIVTDKGGILCHAAIVAREFGIPCIVGTNNATSLLKEGDLIEVNAQKGTVKILT
ncbi:hypothetical protein A2865_01095 [Candidatus Woesebacteria bacterium RIFCSPHIGHO2_01_FULL_39_17]|uniref:Phosphoenolpyruvate synthase, pyruvate, water dikinase n=2 Tax=Microgenomates group TaxID=1794810 RepID=A0A0H4TEC9_9BACT|nr:phosphoenolpyruvate synthase, pyruvate, water dikinase [uncultured Microgenomates bacterium Rifle_16ft_4_minimus_954]KKQ51910.1 MAG: Phosphoenolpyruvate synthase [Microgenomates group bacterium GW2011_GWC1_38_12]KKQ93881.1 MAG: Phosphoenolpyruvate synthase [Candidatus Woesebacteria bacterium GW2011_GWB1_39_10b]OGM22333.1 MAG: hypothetical protein A2865_01095 [Candidatus Woesebacteria bacterium RIFCSPHIGHO2_01_FULL_39_17]